MEAVVVGVDSYVTNVSDMKAQLGSDSLVSSFSASGPVIAVTCELKEDSSTASGYYWSSKKGADVVLTEDTMVSADIITAEKKPITLLLPFLKDKLTIKAGNSASAN